jgi:hypothetical protein
LITRKANVTFIAFPLGERQRVLEWVRYPDREHSNQCQKAKSRKGCSCSTLMLEYFADDGHWTRGRYDDGNGGHCLVGALLHFEVKGWKVNPSHYLNQDLGTIWLDK